MISWVLSLYADIVNSWVEVNQERDLAVGLFKMVFTTILYTTSFKRDHDKLNTRGELGKKKGVKIMSEEH